MTMKQDSQQDLNSDFFNEFSAKGVIIAGGAQGIGAALVEAFHWLGAKVAILDRDEKLASDLCEKLVERTENHFALFKPKVFAADLTDQIARDKAIDDACRWAGPVHSFISTLGIDMRVPADELTQDKLEFLLRVNYVAPVMAARKVMPYLRQGGGGSILLFTSAHGDDLIDAQMAGYGAAKAALINDIRRMALEAGLTNTKDNIIRVNGYCPGWIETDNQLRRFSEDVFEKAASESLLPLRITGEDVAASVVFAVSKYNQLMTGQIIKCDAGGGKIVRDS